MFIGRSVTLNAKVYAGTIIAVASQLVAAWLEYERRDAEILTIPSLCAPLGEDGQHVHMSAMSAWWMAVPYTLIGVGEILVNPVLQHHAYNVPESMRSMLQAFFVFIQGGLSQAVS